MRSYSTSREKIKIFEHFHETCKNVNVSPQMDKIVIMLSFHQIHKDEVFGGNGTVQRRPVECSSLFSLKGAGETQHMVAVSEIKLEEGQDVPAKLWKEAHPEMRIHLFQARNKISVHVSL